MTPENEVKLPCADCYLRHAEVENHLKESKGWRTLMTSLVVAMIIQVGTFIFMWGRLTMQVEYHEKQIVSMEKVIYK